MREAMTIPLARAGQIPLPDAETVSNGLEAARSGFRRKIVVLDDDPTGVQTVHDVSVYTDWRRETLAQGLKEPGEMFFVLTNSRGFTEEETERAHREIARNLAEAFRETQRSFLLVSRGDSTLRGHYPLETQVLRQELEQQLGIRYDGEIIMPYFQEGGRLTIDNIHYVQAGNDLVPVGMTEFSKDTSFAYRASDLTEWCAERTGGAYPANEVTTISLEELRSLDYDGIFKKLETVRNFGKVVVNAADDCDVEVFTTALLRAIKAGKEFLFRCAAALVRVLGGISRRPLLKGDELCPERNGMGGLVIVGSHVKKTTEQLEALLSSGLDLHPVCFNVETVLDPDSLETEKKRILQEAEQAVSSGQTTVVFTSRRVLRTCAESAQENLLLSVRISQALTSIVGDLQVRPGFLVAKGGITSSDVGIRSLRVRRAWVMGQVAPGVPVWRTGEESKFPGLPYVIFPGNVGDAFTLREIVQTLMSA